MTVLAGSLVHAPLCGVSCVLVHATDMCGMEGYPVVGRFAGLHTKGCWSSLAQCHACPWVSMTKEVHWTRLMLNPVLGRRTLAMLLCRWRVLPGNIPSKDDLEDRMGQIDAKLGLRLNQIAQVCGCGFAWGFGLQQGQ
jgi:hypothetical protein